MGTTIVKGSPGDKGTGVIEDDGELANLRDPSAGYECHRHHHVAVNVIPYPVRTYSVTEAFTFH